eukprot:4777801-Alexandrium_andersonii.AAC.1
MYDKKRHHRVSKCCSRFPVLLESPRGHRPRHCGRAACLAGIWFQEGVGHGDMKRGTWTALWNEWRFFTSQLRAFP